MGFQDLDFLLNILNKMDENRLSEGLKNINAFLSENDKKKLLDMINEAKNQKK